MSSQLETGLSSLALGLTSPHTVQAASVLCVHMWLVKSQVCVVQLQICTQLALASQFKRKLVSNLVPVGRGGTTQGIPGAHEWQIIMI